MSEPKPFSLAELRSTLRRAFQDGTQLQITTLVGDVHGDWRSTDGSDDAAWQQRVRGADVPALHTRIDLLDGDITTAIHEQFLAEKYAAVLQLHQAREAQGQQIVRENLRTLMELWKFVSTELKDEPAAPAPGPAPAPAPSTGG